MFVYFGPLIGVNSWKEDEYLGLANSLLNHQHACLSICPDSLASDVFYDSRSIAAFFNLISVAQKPVFVRVGLSPTNFRVSSAIAVGSAQKQMKEIYYLFTAYGLRHLLAGFAINNVLTYQTYADGSRLSRDQLNALVNTSHDVYGRPVAVFVSDGVDLLGRSAPRAARSPVTPASALAVSVIGQTPVFNDILVHMHPIYSLHLADPSRPEETLDWSRLEGILALASSYSSSSLTHAVVQGPIKDWDDDNRYAHSDSLLGVTMDADVERAFRNARQLLNACGFTNIGVVADVAMGAISNVALDVEAFRFWPGAPINTASKSLPHWGSLYSKSGDVSVSWTEEDGSSKILHTDSLLNPIL